METSITFKISFLKETFNGNDLYRDVISKLWFEPKTIHLSGVTKRGVQVYKKRHIELIKASKSDISIVLENEENRFSCLEPAHRNTHQTITMSTTIDSYIKAKELLMNIIKDTDNFVVGYCYSSKDQYLQNAIYESDFKVKGFKVPTDKFKTDEKTGFEIIDISNNPGRMVLVSDMWLTVSWQMWFSKKFFKITGGKENLNQFNEANKIEILNDKITFIELYENPFDADEKQNRAKQKRFREYMEMEKITQKLK